MDDELELQREFYQANELYLSLVGYRSIYIVDSNGRAVLYPDEYSVLKTPQLRKFNWRKDGF